GEPTPGAARLRRRLVADPRHTSRASHEIDRDGNPCEAETLADPVLDPVPVVARDQARVVDEEAEARRARGALRAVEEVQPLRAAGRRLARAAQLGQEAVQLRGRDAGGVAVEQLLDAVEQPLDPAAGLRRDDLDLGPLAELRLQPRPDVVER